MQSLSGSEPQKFGRGPKTRICYICGRQYGLSSYEIHLKQCKDLWIAREALKPPKERKELPRDPTLDLTCLPSIEGTKQLTLEESNALAEKTFNDVSLLPCPYCGRTFLAEKLPIHNRSCTAEKPARRVDENVRRGLPHANTSSLEVGHASKTPSNERTRPSTSGTLRERIRKQVDTSSEHELRGIVDSQPARAEINSLRSTEKLFGHDEEPFSVLQSRVDALEKTVLSLVQMIEDLKTEIRGIKPGR